MRILALLALLPLADAPLGAQADFPRHTVTGGLGMAIPRAELHPFYRNAFAWTVGYGYRPWRYLQLDVAYDGAYNAADVSDYYNSPTFGPLRIRDFQVFLPMGARVIAPLRGERGFGFSVAAAPRT
jgi:hypothetical protein